MAAIGQQTGYRDGLASRDIGSTPTSTTQRRPMGLAFNTREIIATMLGSESAQLLEAGGARDRPKPRGSHRHRVRRTLHGPNRRVVNGLSEPLDADDAGDTTRLVGLEAGRAVFTDAPPTTNPPLCTKCGHGLHTLEALEECPWWRYASRWGDKGRAITAIPELTGRSVGSVLAQLAEMADRRIDESPEEQLLRFGRS
jgi:hypothetical protein